MKYFLAALFTLLPAGLALAQSGDPNKLVYDAGENPDNWCRNGHFPALTQDYRVGEVTRSSPMLGDEDGCPSKTAKCEAEKTVKAGTFVAVSKSFGDFSCTFDPSDLSGGWIATSDIKLSPAPDLKEADWLGNWSDGDNRISITRGSDGLHVEGVAHWFGETLDNGEQVEHDGGIDFVAKPDGNRVMLRAADDYECAVELIHLGRFLVVRDNSYCGGANVRFNSVYLRK